MNNDLYNDEFMVRYLDGECSEQERKQFEQAMENDPGLKDGLMELTIAIEAVRKAATAEKIRGLHSKMMKEETAEEERSDKPVRRIIRYTMAIAASIILAIAVLGIYTYQLSPEKVYEDHFLNFTTSVSRGSMEYASKTPELFEAGKYQEIIDQSKTYSPIPADQLLIAISYLNLDQPSPAIPILQSLQKNERFSQDADYYLGMAYLKNNDAAAALGELKKIHEDEKHPYHKQVTGGLIRELRLLGWKN